MLARVPAGPPLRDTSPAGPVRAAAGGSPAIGPQEPPCNGGSSRSPAGRRLLRPGSGGGCRGWEPQRRAGSQDARRRRSRSCPPRPPPASCKPFCWGQQKGCPSCRAPGGPGQLAATPGAGWPGLHGLHGFGHPRPPPAGGSVVPADPTPPGPHPQMDESPSSSGQPE